MSRSRSKKPKSDGGGRSRDAARGASGSRPDESDAPSTSAGPSNEEAARVEAHGDGPRGIWNRVAEATPHLVVLCMFLVSIFPMLDPDLFWHLRTGRLIWEERWVPLSDRYLFTDYERPWIDLHWGFQLLMAGLYALGGADLLILTKATVLAAAVAIAWRASGAGLSHGAKAAIWIPTVICISGRALERPEMLTQLFLATWLWVAAHAERRPKLLWLLPAIQVVWINVHALFVLGLVVGGCYAADRVIREVLGGRFGIAPPASGPPFRAVAWCGLLCAVAALFNPYFEEGALFPLELYKKFSVDQSFWRDFVQIGEFQRPSDFLWKYGVRGYANIFVLSQIALTLAAFGSFVMLLSRRRWSPYRALLFAGFAHLGWEATRNVNIYAFVASFVTIANFADFARIRREAAEMAGTKDRPNAGTRTGSDSAQRPRGRVSDLVAAGVLAAWAVSIVTGLWNRIGEDKRPFALGERPAWFAHEAIRFAGQPGFPDHAILGHIGLAGVYEFHHATDRKVFVDPRLEVCTQETFRRYAGIFGAMAAADRRWEQGLRDAQGRLPVVILDSRGGRPQINGLLQTPGWRLVFADHAAAVFLESKQADQLGLRPVSPAPLLSPP